MISFACCSPRALRKSYPPCSTAEKNALSAEPRISPPCASARPKRTPSSRLYDAIENGVADLADPLLKDRIAELKATRDQARADAERAEGAMERLGPAISHRRPSKPLPGRPAGACAPSRAAIAATTCALA
jgi:hypothetical protein